MTKLTSKNVWTLMPPEGLDRKSLPDDDLPGHYLRVSNTGARSFTVQYEFGGKTRRMTLGTPAILTLSQSREAARGVLAKVRLGRDPANERAEANRRAADTFGSELKAFFAAEAKKVEAGKVKPRTYERTERCLMVHAEPLHRLPLSLELPDLKRQIADRVLEIERGPGPAAANATGKSVSGYCRWLFEIGFLAGNPCTDLYKATENGSREHVIGFPRKEDPTPFDGELGALWNVLVAAGDEQSVIVRLLILLLMRRCEIDDLRWSETRLDTEQPQLVLPWHRTKQKAAARKKFDFIVPLPALAAELLRSLPRRPGRDLIFGRGHGDRGFQGWDKLKQDIDARLPPSFRAWRLHDIRRCGSTAIAEYNLAPAHIREAILGHSVGGVAGIYCLAEYIAPRRIALELWCSFVLDLAAGRQPEPAPNVVTMPPRAS